MLMALPVRPTSEKRMVLQLHANALQYVGDPGAPRPAWKGLNWRKLLSPTWRQDDKESIFCYALCVAVFVADYSVLALAFPVALYVYALLAQTPATRFWQASLFAGYRSAGPQICEGSVYL